MEKKHVALVLIGVVFSAIGIAYANTPVRTPEGFTKLVVFMAAGQYDHDVPYGEDLLAWFKYDVMGFSDAQWDAERQNAHDWFMTQFGLDVPLDMIMDNVVDPRNEYRAYIISGMDVPSEGWVVRDGGFMAMTPDGPIVYGFYSIDVTGPGKSGKNPAYVEPIVITYKSLEPIKVDANFNGYFRCAVDAPWGPGIAQGIISNIDLGDGVMITNWRAVQTYPSYGPSVIHHPAP